MPMVHDHVEVTMGGIKTSITDIHHSTYRYVCLSREENYCSAKHIPLVKVIL